MFLLNFRLKQVEIDTSKGDKHFLLKNLDLAKVLDSTLGGDKCIANMQLRILQCLAPIFLLLNIPYSYKGFISWLGEPKYTYIGIILL